MIIKNGLVLNDSFEFEDSDISFGKKIDKIESNIQGDDVIDAKDCYVVPGFIDTHMHGGVGFNFINLQPEAYEKVGKIELENGTTSLCPALSAAVHEKMVAAAKIAIKEIENPRENCSRYIGLHFEGPFFNVKFKGAHLPENIRIPTIEEFDRLYEASKGYMKIITMAPELENGMEVTKHATEKGVKVSIGHSAATYQEAKEAFENGADRTTHTYNAMSPLNHREPGVVGVALMTPDVNAELICDFFHVCPDVVKLTYDIKGADKITMITDSELGTGFPDGVYEVNGRFITITDKKTYTEDGTIAGGTSFLIDGVKNMVSIGVPLNLAVKMATINPAKAVGMENEIGSLKTGKIADILVLDKQLNIKHIFLNGKKIK